MYKHDAQTDGQAVPPHRARLQESLESDLKQTTQTATFTRSWRSRAPPTPSLPDKGAQRLVGGPWGGGRRSMGRLGGGPWGGWEVGHGEVGDGPWEG